MKENILIRSLVFIFGLFIMAFAVALSVKANLGVSPISCIPYILSERYSLTMGQLTMLFNGALILLQILLLRKNYKVFQLVQLPVVVLFGFFIDLTLFMVSGIEVSSYGGKMALCLLSCALLALGVLFEVKAKVTYLPGEGVAVAFVDTLEIEFGKAKIVTDSTMVIIGALSSILFFHQFRGTREGTIIAAVLVGILVKAYSRMLDRISGGTGSFSSPELQSS